MENIGKLIKTLRIYRGLTQKELSEGICSQKYVYLIEKEERNASFFIIEQFNRKLKVNIMDYFPYIGCEDPVSIKNVCDKFAIYQRESDFNSIRDLLSETKKYKDFKIYPWKLTVELNYLLYDIFINGKYFESNIKINKLLNSLPSEYIESEYVVHLLVLKSIVNQILGNFNEADLIVTKNLILVDKINLHINNPQLTVSVKLNSFILNYLKKNYHSAIEQGKNLLNYQYYTNHLDRAHYTYLYLSYCYYEINVNEQAYDLFEKGIYNLLFNGSCFDLETLISQSTFQRIIKEYTKDNNLLEILNMKHKECIEKIKLI